MLNFFITRGGEQGTQFEIGWGHRVFNFTPSDRQSAEAWGTLGDGEWLEDGRWFVLKRWGDSPRLGIHWRRIEIAFGKRYWIFTAEWPCPDYDSEEGRQHREEDGNGRWEAFLRDAVESRADI